MAKKKIKFGSRSYMQPTPRNLQNLGKGLIGFALVLTTAATAKDDEWLSYIGIGITAFATFLVDFFGEHEK